MRTCVRKCATASLLACEAPTETLRRKAPAVWQQTKDYVDQLHELQTLLDKAIAKEDYEKAAELRDKITNLKTDYAATAKTP